jgi:PrtD family type I secretion system ABC transporter
MDNQGRWLRREVTRALRPAFAAAGLFSLAINLLLLVSPLYMLQVYDRVLTSGSVDTLVLLSVLALALLGVFAAADSGRRRVLALIGRALGELLEHRLFATGMGAAGRRLESAVADLGRVQGLFANGTIQPLFDAPFVPMFALFVFLVHPLLGAVTLAGAVGLVLLAVAAERAGTVAVERSSHAERAATRFLSGIGRQFAAVRAMGMGPAVERRWQGLRDAAAIETLETARTTAFYGGVSKAVRQMLQVVTLGVAAWLVLRQEISAGAIIASSILAGRCLAPIDQIIGAWRPLLQARKSWSNLAAFVPPDAEQAASTPLPRPQAELRLRELTVDHPGGTGALFEPVDLRLTGGQTLLVLGRSGQGKTSLLQVLSGAATPAGGSVSLGGRNLHAWDMADRGAHIGFLPQYVDLLPGTVAENIVRFADAGPDAAIAAARRAGCHEAILQLAGGYDTPIGGEAPLSAGQRQDIGLARAVHGEPVALFLDEPTAHLDLRGVSALLDLLAWQQQQGRIAVIASHDRRLLTAASLVLELRDGRAVLAERDAYVRALAAAVPARVGVA